jgi:hypothetical protein
MGAAGFGQSFGGNTGVGSAPTQDNIQTQGPAMGGKGGGYGTPQQASNPYASSQPKQSQPPAYQPVGGNAFGYNMQRLAQRMDPSASLPPPQQTSTYDQMQTAQAAPTGGKGGGEGAFGIPQEIMPYAVDAVARSYGYQPYEPSFFGQQQPQGQYRTQVEPYDPFQQGYDARTERLDQLERQYQDLISRAQNQPQDTGEKLADLPQAYENQNLGVGQSTEEAAQEAAESAANPPPPPPPAPRTYQEIRTGNKTALRNLQQQNKKEIADLKASGATKEAIKAAVLANKQEVKTQKQTNKQNLVGVERPVVRNPAYQFLGAGSPQFQNQYVYAGTSIPAPAPTTTPAPRPGQAASTGLAEQRAQNVGVKKGGIIHKGMTSNLKKQLKSK